ncbi:hypothetical protein B5P45_06030 [Phyllobacterium zundukense]|uniref:Uncharacterized protein n=2 Tax=Phyllobacterium zundukense TaxID=1867719 RepID=A0A2N9W1E5_9HYPH|nr:hypothetical protein BLM14_08495 [Phyllobacterium zundukense]PIO45563.1 hypothetical protein B5P45_06030 [Phyllobacterium zundukense]
MEHAYAQASALLKRSPKTDPRANRLARTVMMFFNRGMRDPDLIAAVAANREISREFRDSIERGTKPTMRERVTAGQIAAALHERGSACGDGDGLIEES